MEERIPLIKSLFFNEKETKEKLSEYIKKESHLSMGKKCKEFEDKFSKFQGRKYSVLVNSGSSANLAIIQALLNLDELKRGDKVGFSALTWSTNVMPLIQLGLDPVPIDVSLSNLNVTSENLIKILKKEKIKALFITNLLGFCGDLDKIKDICEKEGIILIEDNCESLGSELNGKKLGNYGLASTFSFFVGHHLSTIEGGMVCTDDRRIYKALLMVREHGWSRRLEGEDSKKLKEAWRVDDFYNLYTFYSLGYNIRPTEITGFLGICQLDYINEIIFKREENFKKFKILYQLTKLIKKLDFSHMNKISNFAFPLVFNNKKDFETYKRKFIEKNIEIRPIVGGSIVQQPFFINYMRKQNKFYKCPNAEEIHKLGFYFPNNPELKESEIKKIIDVFN